MIEMYPKAVVLTTHHPFGATVMMAQSIAGALDANGYDTQIVNINESDSIGLGQLLKDPRLDLVLSIGTMPLQVRFDDIPIWHAVHPDVQFVLYIIDAWPYDAVRVTACRAFIADWLHSTNLHVATPEANDARLIGKRAHYFPTGAYPAPRLREPKENPDRLMIWASVNKELAITPVHDQFEQTIACNNAWGLDGVRISRMAEALRHTELVHGLSAIAAALAEPLEAIMLPTSMTALCAIDSCLKRYRRVKIVRSLEGLPVDIYGENWQQYAGNFHSFRLLQPDPNHNHAFSYLCQHYAGLFNFDPNFGHGTNERAVSALSMGIPIANNFNLRTDHAVGCIPYHFSQASIRHAAERLLSYGGPVPLNPTYTWDHLTAQLLLDIASEPPQMSMRHRPSVNVADNRQYARDFLP